jgi:hypothetical protein
LKIRESLTDVRRFIDRFTRQNLPASPPSETFSTLMSEYLKPKKTQSHTELKNPGAMTLEDYRQHALPVRSGHPRSSSLNASIHFNKSRSTASSTVPDRIQKVIDDAARKYQIPAELITAVIRVESNFDPHAVSSEGAQGLMQLMPGTAKDLGVRNAFDVKENIDAGSRYLKEMLDQFDGKLELALAAYNAGPGAVTRHKGIPPYRETRQYIKKVMAYC